MHIANKCQLLLGVLIRVMMGFAGLARQGFHRPVKPFLPEVDVRPTLVVLPAGSCNAILFTIFHQGVAEFHVLCYTLHET